MKIVGKENTFYETKDKPQIFEAQRVMKYGVLFMVSCGVMFLILSHVEEGNLFPYFVLSTVLYIYFHSLNIFFLWLITQQRLKP